MRFRRAVLNTPALAAAYRHGLQALNASDAEHVDCVRPRLLAGSVNIDFNLRHVFPDAPRWDYAVGINHTPTTDAVIWIEVHPASSTGEVDRVLSKLNWLKIWVVQDAPRLGALTREYVWVATGQVSFSPNSPHAKRLAAAGIHFAGRHYSVK